MQLETLLDHWPLLDRLTVDAAGPADLAADLEVSRSTVDRGLADLRTAGLVERADGRYRATVAGSLAVEAFDRLADRLGTVADASALLATLPDDAALDPRLLDGCDVVLTGDGADVGNRPDGPIGGDPAASATAGDATNALAELLAAGTRLRAVVPSIDDRAATAAFDAVRDGLEVEVALPDEAVEALLADRQRSIAGALETGRLSLRETTDPPPYGLLVVDRDEHGESRRRGAGGDAPAVAAVAVCVDGALRGLLVSDAPASLEWANATLEAVWADSRPLTDPGGG